MRSCREGPSPHRPPPPFSDGGAGQVPNFLVHNMATGRSNGAVAKVNSFSMSRDGLATSISKMSGLGSAIRRARPVWSAKTTKSWSPAAYTLTTIMIARSRSFATTMMESGASIRLAAPSCANDARHHLAGQNRRLPHRPKIGRLSLLPARIPTFHKSLHLQAAVTRPSRTQRQRPWRQVSVRARHPTVMRARLPSERLRPRKTGRCRATG